jgi:hypothetical protein
MTQSRHQRGPRLLPALAAATALLVVIVGVPAVLAVIGGVPRGVPSARELEDMLSTRDGSYAQILGAGVVWVAWAVFTAATVKEAAASVRMRGPRPAALGAQGVHRLLPAALVASVAVLFVAGPALTGTAPHAAADTGQGRPAGGGTSAAAPQLVQQPAAAPLSSTRSRAQPTGTSTRGDDLPVHEVRRYETLWSIAKNHLPGDPAERYKDIRDLNPDQVGQDNKILPGARLRLPADAYSSPIAAPPGDAATREIDVERGDTLSGIAAEHGVEDWRTVWPLNEGRRQPGGDRFTDPHHIEPGWTVVMPVESDAKPPAATAPPLPSPPRRAPDRPAVTPRAEAPPPPASPAIPSPGTAAAATPAAAPTGTTGAAGPLAAAPTATAAASAEQPDPTSEDAADRAGLDPWQAVFAGGGTLLAAGLLTRLVGYRRRQFRYRRPGRTITETPAELIPAEKALLRHGRRAVADVQFVDHALRSLSAATAVSPDRRLPQIVAARLLASQLDVLLAAPHPTPPPAPWTADESGMWWSVSASDELPVDDRNAAQYLAPFPTLVTVGFEPGAGTWLVDLEEVGALALTGDPDRCLDLGRFIAAELAVSAWSDGVSVTLVGFGEELVQLNPARLRHTGDLASAAAQLIDEVRNAVEAIGNTGLDVLSGRMRAVAGDSWMPHVLLVAPTAADADGAGAQLEQLLTALRSHPQRTTVAVVLAGDQPSSNAADQRASVSADGSLAIPSLGVELTAQQMTASEAAPFADMLGYHAEALQDAPVPPSTGDRPYEQFVDAAGALRPDVTLPRSGGADAEDALSGGPASDSVPAAPAGATSVLPREDEAYLRHGATTREDLQALAPRVDAKQRARIIAMDPTLDDDLADWWHPQSPTPKLTVFGPPELKAGGVAPPGRIAYYTEHAVFLATRERGATAEQVAAAFNIGVATAYSKINTLRKWLGDEHLPEATKSAGGKARGLGVYELVGVTFSADLFKRLRARGQALGGAQGVAYLEEALRLVGRRPWDPTPELKVAPPFDQLRTGGYEWLADTPLHHHLTVAVVDVAHTVHLHHLEAGDLPRARAAAELAGLAAPSEETPRLDLVAVLKAEGHSEAADRYLRDEVCNRDDDGEGPMDLPERTAEISRRHAWLSRAG